MERFESVPNPEQARIAKLADLASAWAAKVDLKRTPKGHVYRALDELHIAEQNERERLIPLVMKELHRRNGGRGKTPFSERTDLIEDARRREAQHPSETDDEN